MTPLDFGAVRDGESSSWMRARPDAALIERLAWNRWLVMLVGGAPHVVRLERDHGAYAGMCDCPGFEYHGGPERPCAHLCTVRKAEFIQARDTRGQLVETFDLDDVVTERADHDVERALADGGGWL